MPLYVKYLLFQNKGSYKDMLNVFMFCRTFIIGN